MRLADYGYSGFHWMYTEMEGEGYNGRKGTE
jgi:hypothetical protein